MPEEPFHCLFEQPLWRSIFVLPASQPVMDGDRFHPWLIRRVGQRPAFPQRQRTDECGGQQKEFRLCWEGFVGAG